MGNAAGWSDPGTRWGLGLGGGYLLAFDVLGVTPPAWRGPTGFWIASTAGWLSAGVVLTAVLLWMQQHRTRALPAGAPA